MKKRIALAVLLPAAVLVVLGWLSCSHQQAATAMKQEDRLALAQDLAARGRCSKAVLEYEKLLSEFPKPQVAETAKFNLGKCRFETGEYEVAVTDFEDFINTYPRSELVDNAMYMIGLCYLRQAPRPERDQAKTSEALEELNLVLRKYPTSDIKADVEAGIIEARSRLAEKDLLNARLYARLADYKSARIYYDHVVATYSDTPWAATALLEKGGTLEREGDPGEARRAYEQLIRDFPTSGNVSEATRRLKELGGGSDTKTETSSKN